MSRNRWRDPVPRDGQDGRSVDLVQVEQMIAAAVDRAMADRPIPRNGRDADPAAIRAEVERVVRAEIEGASHATGEKDVGRGPRGPIGPMPAHRWRGTFLQFEQAPGGEWGDAIDLHGQKGDPGINAGGGGIVNINSGNGWFPGGWS